MRRAAGPAVLVAALGLWCAAAAADQGVGRHCPSASFGYTALPAAGLSRPAGAEVETRESRLSAGFASYSRGAFALDFGLDYAYTRHEYAGVSGRDRDLHRLQLPLGVSREAGRWRIDGFLAPGVATSSNVFKDLTRRATGEDFLLTGGVEARLARGPRSAWLLGVAHDRSFGESRTLPVAGIEYRPSDALGLRLAWPDPALEVTVSERQRLVFDLFPAGHRWHVVSDELGATFEYRLEAWRARAAWSYRLADPLVVDVYAGREFGREHDFTDDAGVRIDADADDQWLMGIGFRIGGISLPRGRGPALPRFAPAHDRPAP